ncbi:MAG: hypothetical protein ABI175_14040, partial [Polyangiales bacterium]
VLLYCMAQTTPNQTTELETLLARAAELAAKDDVDSADFMSAAWNAILDAHPGMREELADKELRSQLKKLRKQGLIGLA